MLSWSDTIDKVPGLGARRGQFLCEQGFPTIGDFLLRAPLRFIDRRNTPPFDQLPGMASQEITAVGTIEAVGEMGYSRRKRLVCHITDGKGHLQAVWFKSYHYLKSKLQPGTRVAFTGKLTYFDGPQIAHPQITFLNEKTELSDATGLEPVYPSGEEWERLGLHRRFLPKLIARILDDWDGEGPYLPDNIQRTQGLLSLWEAINGLHRPQSTQEFDRAVESLKFSELFHHQLLMVSLRRRRKSGDGMVIDGRGETLKAFVKALPFKLSDGQKQVLREIGGDIGSGHPMYRLMQGEVGAGKTVVAFTCAAMAKDAGYQTALMAPTELLARQHYRIALDWCEKAGMKAVLVAAGRQPDEIHRALYEAATGGADLIIGTHALFQKRVKLPKLGLVVIDEQQRFGVRQRARLVSKGSHPHVLLMTATPIPRTLALAHYGDLDLSFLPALPGSQRSVRTRVVNDSKRDRVFGWLRKKLKEGETGYLVYPVIDQSSAGLEAAQARYEPYRKIDFKGVPMALVHGRLPVEERIRSMENFRERKVRLLMATAVVEVGVDVPHASLMVVENSERFGLAQLHQLRGRIGREGQPAVCVFLTPERPGEPGFERLRYLETSNDGFILAEQDMKLRGSGEPLGARQSGMARFQFADLAADRELLQRAHRQAERLLDDHPDLAPFPDLRAKVRRDYRDRPRTILAG